MNITAAIFFVLMSALSAGFSEAGQQQGINLVIEPERVAYALDEAAQGGVAINARFVNGSDEPIFVAHPTACVPEDYDGKRTFNIEERRGRSELIVYITGPDGKQTVLSNNMLRGFEPGNKFGLTIPPGGSETVRLGFFSPYFALGMWNGFDGPVFSTPGRYRMRVVYTNSYGKTLSFGSGADIFAKDRPWTGEAVSNEITISVE